MKIKHRTIALAAFLASLVAAHATAMAEDEPPWLAYGSLAAELRASGTHVGFVPGDAFFPIRIEDSLSFKEVIPYFTDDVPYVDSTVDSYPQEASDDPQNDFVEYDYQYPAMVETVQPDWAGFGRARIHNLTEDDADILREFYGCVFFEQEEISADRGRPRMWGDVEGKPQVAIAIVNRGFDFEKYRLYVRYNENWNDDNPAYPSDRSYIQEPSHYVWPQLYRPHVATAEAVLEDWQNGPRVPSLKVTFPESLEGAPYEGTPFKITSPIEIDFRNVAFVGYPTADVQEIFTRPLNSTFYVATHEGVHRYRWIFSTKAVRRELVKELIYDPDNPGDK